MKRANLLIMTRLNAILNGMTHNTKELIAHSIFRRVLSFVVALNICAVILSSFSELKTYNTIFLTISYFSAIIFTVEYGLRIYSAPAKRKNVVRIKARLQYATSFMGLVDLITIIPFLVQNIDIIANEYIYVSEIAKIFLIFKLARYSGTFKFIIDVFKTVKIELLFGWTVALSIILFSGVLMYYVERNAQPEVFYNAGQGLWWSVITFATVGYGDIYPVTAFGKLIAGLIAMVGIGMLALPAGIISSAFIGKMNEAKERRITEGKTQHKIKSIIKSSIHNSSITKTISEENTERNEDDDNKKKCYCPYCGSKLNDNN